MNETQNTPQPGQSENGFDHTAPTDNEPVWTYRGYKLRASEFTTAMVHFFRAEVNRANVWRQRLDATTNWAVVTTGATVSIAFSQSGGNHGVILVNLLLATVFLLIEARRYRYYELWSYRVRLMETDFFAPMLVPPFHPSAEWAEALAENLLHPHFQITNWEAIGRRLRRNYLYIYAIIGFAWLAKLSLFPEPVSDWQGLVERAAIGSLSGSTIMVLVGAFFVALIIFGIATIGMQHAAGEVLPRYGHVTEPIGSDHLAGHGYSTDRAWFRPAHRRKQLLTIIITDQAQLVSDKIIKDMRRGVTSLAGVGMYTGAPHQILMCALTVTEIPQLRELIKEIDPKAFVIVSPAQEVFGKGFRPLDEGY